MKKYKILLLLTVGMFALTGCNKATNNNSLLPIFDVNAENVKKIEIIHGNKIVYPDLENKDKLNLMKNLNTVLENTRDKMVNLNEDLGITLAEAEGYAQKDAEYYYVYVTFSDQQTLIFTNNSMEEKHLCDGILLDINNMKLNWSKDGDFVGTMGYADNTTSVKSEYSTYLKVLGIIFADLGN